MLVQENMVLFYIFSNTALNIETLSDMVEAAGVGNTPGLFSLHNPTASYLLAPLLQQTKHRQSRVKSMSLDKIRCVKVFLIWEDLSGDAV